MSKDALTIDDVVAGMSGPTHTRNARSGGTPPAPQGAGDVGRLVEALDRQTTEIRAMGERRGARSSERDPAPRRRAKPAQRRRPAARSERVTDLLARTRRLLDESRGNRRQRMLHQLRESDEEGSREARRGRRDPLVAERSRRINQDIDRSHDEDRREQRGSAQDRMRELEEQNRHLQRRLRRPPRPSSERGTDPRGRSQRSAAFATYRRAIDRYMRYGEEVFDGVHLRQIVTRAMNTQVDPEGGYLVHPEYDTGPLEKLLMQISPMRGLASIQQISTGVFKKPVGLRGMNGYWASQGEPAVDTNTPALAQLEFPVHVLMANPQSTQEMLEDAQIDPEQMLSEEAQETFAELEGAAFIAGSGFGQPKGFLAYDKVIDASWAWNKIGYAITGVSGGFHATLPGDVIKTTPLMLKAALRNQATWLMNRGTIGGVRTIKASDGHYLWSEGDMSKGIPNTLDGYIVHEDEQMPAIAADAHAIAFGAWKKGYLIVDRTGFWVLRNPYKSPPSVYFHMQKRVGGGVKDFEAIKTVKFGTS